MRTAVLKKCSQNLGWISNSSMEAIFLTSAISSDSQELISRLVGPILICGYYEEHVTSPPSQAQFNCEKREEWWFPVHTAVPKVMLPLVHMDPTVWGIPFLGARRDCWEIYGRNLHLPALSAAILLDSVECYVGPGFRMHWIIKHEWLKDINLAYVDILFVSGLIPKDHTVVWQYTYLDFQKRSKYPLESEERENKWVSGYCVFY